MSRPNIGITAATEDVSYGVWDEVPAFISPASYVRAVKRAGGRSVLLVPNPEDAEDPNGVLDLVDALIHTGGAGDVNPGIYGKERHPETGPIQNERDAYELALARAAVERGLPTLGICRGMEVLNVVYGGILEQHLPDVLEHEEHRHTPGTYAAHKVRLEPGSLAARAAGSERTPVKSHHHQGIKEVGSGLKVTGWAAEDGAIEALEDPSCPFVLGVPEHAEEDEKSQIIRPLVSEVSR